MSGLRVPHRSEAKTSRDSPGSHEVHPELGAEAAVAEARLQSARDGVAHICICRNIQLSIGIYCINKYRYSIYTYIHT